MAPQTQDISLTAADGRPVQAAIAVPDGAGPWPGVVVVHELFGIDDQMRLQLGQLAGMGYLALMPNLYTDGGMRRCLISTLRSLRSGRGRAYSDIEASGFCAASTNYGDLPRDMDTTLRGACPVVGSYGGRDITKKGAAARLDRALTRLDIPHDVKEYPSAGHVFLNSELNGWPWLRPIVRVLHFGPEPVAAADAWSRIRAFFDAHLRLDPQRPE
jgi:carboxymethylenebutenolidase